MSDTGMSDNTFQPSAIDALLYFSPQSIVYNFLDH